VASKSIQTVAENAEMIASVVEILRYISSEYCYQHFPATFRRP